jgi:phenylacetate-CoA ligase
MEQSADLKSADQPDTIRWPKFQAMLGELVEKNSFQQSHWPQIKNVSQLDGFAQFQEQCPFTTKDMLAKDRIDNPPYGTNLTYPLNQYTRFHQTSGTLGVPMAWLDTPDDWQWMLGNWDLVLENADVQKGEKCFFAFSFGPFLGFWTAHDAATQRGCLCIPGGGQSSEQRLKTILEQKADHLFCTPTYALRLPEVAEEAGIDLSNNHLRSIIVAGETGGSQPGHREKIVAQWNGVRVIDHYGMTEVGPVAYEIPGGQGGLRIIADSYFPEVIDSKSGLPVAEGALGELVLTTLGRTGCPVLRYRTGDLVRLETGMDQQGNPIFDLIGGILGRTDDMVVVRGVNLYPASVDAVIRRFNQVREYRVYKENIGSMVEIKIKVEAEPEITKLVEAELKDAFSLRIPVESVDRGTFPRFEMKAKRWEDK